MRTRRKFFALAAVVAAAGAAVAGISTSSASSSVPTPISPIQHVVVIFDENVSFDHYFGTYPTALNAPGEPAFHALAGTPSVNGLSGALATANPNLDLPARLDPSQALTCDQNHGYSAEQAAFDGGLMDKFVQDTTGSGCTQSANPDTGSYGPNGIVMDYYDGNTVTGLWNLAQHFSLNDNSFSTQFGPSTPGAINLISGQTGGAVLHGGTSTNVANGTDIGDAEPYYDQCSNATLPLNTADTSYSPLGAPGGVTMSMTGKNIGDLMNAEGMTWGWFQAGFAPSAIANGRAICATAHTNIGGASVADYSEHHEPFQYYASTANPYHNAPSSVSKVGVSDPAGTALTAAVNHQYDLSWFNKALTAGDMPQVSFLKAPEYEDGHAGYSDPLDEQRFIADEVDQIEQSQYWRNTAIVIAYDDSDGWYDHQMGPIITPSEDAADALDGAGKCGSSTSTPSPNDRCGVGPRQPLLVISPWSKQNFVDNTFTDQSSITRFIEDNWTLGRIGGAADAQAGTLDNMFDFGGSGNAPAIILSDQTGEVTQTVPTSSSGGATGPSGSSGASGTSQGNVLSAGTTSGAGTSTTGAGPSQPSSNPAFGASGNEPSTTDTGALSSTPGLHCSEVLHGSQLVLSCKVSHAPAGASAIRARLYRGGTLLANQAGVVRDGKAAVKLALGRHSRRSYTLKVTLDAAGALSSQISHLTVH
ncbi:MAG TPA: alkaline phosphatase family protein [Solirubrobacteraceae bacterium]